MAESVKTIGTTKDKTMAIETRAGVLKNETPELKAHIYLQYMGKEFSTADVMKQIRQIWTKELRRSPEELRSVNVYLKPEEFAAFLRSGAMLAAPAVTAYHEQEDNAHEE